jgi:hypothetical protein
MCLLSSEQLHQPHEVAGKSGKRFRAGKCYEIIQ